MLLTDEQAREKWCPHVRAVRHEEDDPIMRGSTVRAVGGCNTGGNAARVPTNCCCIGSACAMWRWIPATTMICWGGPATMDSPGGGPGYSNAQTGKQIDATDAKVCCGPKLGYCGLAGKP